MQEAIQPFSPRSLYRALFRRWGPQDWWPGDTAIEIIVGAILTQNTAWTNVELAIKRLKREKALNARKLFEVEEGVLAEWIRPAGYYNLKARRLKAFLTLLFEEFGGRLARMDKLDTPELRRLLLGVKGIGPETADCILLYAFGRPVFVIDAYTRRFLLRHRWITGEESYDELADRFVRALPEDPVLFNEYHALIVNLAKQHCKTRAECDTCPLKRWLPAPPPGEARGSQA